MTKLQELNELIVYLKKYNQFYKKKYENVSVPIKSILEVPFLYREEIRDNPNEIISEVIHEKKMKKDYTNGTTEGRPLEIIKTEEEWIQADFALWKIRRQIDRKSAARYAFYYFNGENYSNEIRKYGSGNRRTIQFPMKKSCEEQFAEDLKIIAQEKISWLIAPPSIIFTLCCVAIKYGIQVKINVIESISEYLPQFYKKLFELVFSGRVYIHYSCHEVWGMGFSGEDGVLHIMDDCILLQKNDTRFKGNYGRCIVTNLKLKSMPFVNYELSDLIRIVGDKVYTYGFRWTEEAYVGMQKIHCSFFDNIFIEFKEMELRPLENYQIIYSKTKILILLVTTHEEDCIKVTNYLQNRIGETYGGNIIIECKKTRRFLVDTVSGKMRGIIAKENVNFHDWEFGFVNMESENTIDKIVMEMGNEK